MQRAAAGPHLARNGARMGRIEEAESAVERERDGDEVERVRVGREPPLRPARHTGVDQELPPAEVETEAETLPLEIDLRGLTADEVGFPLAGALERAYHTGRPIVRFIHGKGTGVLRRRVAELLDRHPYVREFRTGHWNEGGDGVTIATLTGPDGKE